MCDVDVMSDDALEIRVAEIAGISVVATGCVEGRSEVFGVKIDCLSIIS